ncbi:MAG: FixH family protein [Gallionella sp.]|nr:FixH family protein [Gallionella sp.]MDD4947616.1 FixH family protein [Gallionella sp.]
MLSQKNKQGWRNPWVFGLLAVILSGVLINAKFFWNVTQHPTRILDENYSVKSHNKYDAKWLQEQAERTTLGWQTKLHSPQRLENDPLATPDAARFILLANPAEMKFELKNSSGVAIEGAQVEIVAQWPGDPKFDFNTKFQATDAGEYVASMTFPRAGNWDLIIKASKDGRDFDTEQKVFVAIPK